MRTNVILRKRRRCARGLTLIDVSISVLIVGILSVAAAPKFTGWLRSEQALAAAKRIQSDLAWVQQNAITSSTSRTVQFGVNTEDYTIAGVQNLNRSGQTYRVVLSQYPYEAVINTASLGGDSSLVFSRFGMPDSGGTVTVVAGGVQRTVTIDASTGKATIQ